VAKAPDAGELREPRQRAAELSSQGELGLPIPPVLVVVGTPIGNLSDVSDRAKAVLGTADLVVCEDTRRTRALLSYLGLKGKRLLALYGGRERQRSEAALQALRSGELVALVCDAGMPLVSDPGEDLVRRAIENGFPVSVVPGPSAVLAALVVSGLPTGRFCMEGFLARSGAVRREQLARIAGSEATTVFFESPQRLSKTFHDLAEACGPDRPAVIARELTKLHESVLRGTLSELIETLDANEAIKGEIVVLVGGAPRPERPVHKDRYEALSPRSRPTS
jgi:16S rRNA (cytidine1402-2'-O)-methyltransferase